MSPTISRWRRGAATAALVGLAAAVSSGPARASVSAGASGQSDPIVTYFQTHHGVMPTVAEAARIKAWRAAHPNAVTATTATSANTLAFGGGTNGIGVMSGAKTKVYLVFFSSQWGTQTTDANGDAQFSGDPDGAASAVQQMFKGIGTNGETWSADLTQWCDGAGVSTGAVSCPSSLPGAQYVPYQSGGTLAGVWNDTSAYPSSPNGNALAQEATNAAAHFGNTTAASNRNSYYVILSPQGTNPDGYQGSYCAWHDYTADSANLSGGAVATPYGNIAFSNQPYNMDSGSGCGQGFVNSPGTLDGYTMTIGHEWHEMMSDVDPNSGWANPGTNGGTSGSENSDECAWIKPGQTGGAANISFGAYGTFAEQASWSNDTNSCAISHAILAHGNAVTVGSVSAQSWSAKTAVSLPMTATDSASGQTFTWSAVGLPAGVSISSTSGLISGTPTAAASGSATVTATDTTGASGSTTFSWSVASGGTTNTVTVTNPGNQSTAVGTAASLQIHASDSASGQTLTYSAAGLPAGLSISSSTGLISGTPSTAGSSNATVTATDTTGASGTTSFTWTVGGSTGCTAAQLIVNGGFESGTSPWTGTTGTIGQTALYGIAPHSGSYASWLDGNGYPTTETIAQTVAIPSGCTTATFSFWRYVDTSESALGAADTLKVQVLNSSGTVLGTLATYSNLNADNRWDQASFSLGKYAGQTVKLKFTGTETDAYYGTTDFVLDDAAVNVS